MGDSELRSILSDIEQSVDGAGVGAFFDFDGTLISGYSATAFIKEQIMSGAVSPREFRDQFEAGVKFARGKAGFSSLLSATAASMRGRAEYWFEEFGETVYRKEIAGSIYPESRALVKAHIDKGHTVAVISSATKYQVQPVADDLGIRHVICSRLEVKDGIFTGEIVRPTCFGEGKRTAAEKLAKKTGADLDESFFYTDSSDDLPLLDAVGRPRVLNPNRKLARIARERGWETYRFTSRGRVSVPTLARTALAYGALPAAFAAAAPVWALTGRKRDMINLAVGMWADYAAAIAGIRLHIDGEENLWKRRPAVFIFNHQSSVDALIIPKLLRRDFTGVGKKEIARFPIIGPLMQFAEVVLIDRADGAGAIKAMRPVVDAIRRDGLSVSIAPEGTRSVSTKLGAFKKGAFHIAMQAGAPIVPIVIHNAADSQPKGRAVPRPADIRVTVLPPIDTLGWRAETVGDHVAYVRNLYLDALGQSEPEDDEELSLDHWDDPDEAADEKVVRPERMRARS